MYIHVHVHVHYALSRITREHRENLVKVVYSFAGRSKDQLKAIQNDFSKKTKAEKNKDLGLKAYDAVCYSCHLIVFCNFPLLYMYGMYECFYFQVLLTHKKYVALVDETSAKRVDDLLHPR